MAFAKIDFILVTDASISLKKVAESFSASAKTGVDAAQKSCPGDTRIVWLGIQGTWEGTSFDKSVESYLLDLGVDKSKLHSRDVGSISGAGAKEDADRAIIDLATHFDWRDGAARAILYIGDESLEGGGETGINDPAQRKAVDSAIATCNTFDVPVYTYFAADPNKKATKAEVKTLYTAISENTGGKCWDASTPVDSKLFEQIICLQVQEAEKKEEEKQKEAEAKQKEKKTPDTPVDVEGGEVATFDVPAGVNQIVINFNFGSQPKKTVETKEKIETRNFGL